MLPRLLRVAAPVLLVGLSQVVMPACGSALPGTELGTYRVEGTVKTNTCGTGPGAPSPWVFYVQLSRQDQSIFWSWQDGTPPASGVLDATSKATIHGSQIQSVGGYDGGPASCTLERADAMTLTLAAGDRPSSFDGTVTYSFTIDQGACTAAFTSAGGTYDALPCSIAYTLAGTRK